MYRILIVEDDRALRTVNKIYFEQAGFQVYEAENVEQAYSKMEQSEADCVLLDISLPDGNGFEICSKMKEKRDIPIIFVSNHLEEENRINGFLAGGDDYITKPYSLKELELRVYARLKPYGTQEAADRILHFPPIEIYVSTRTVVCGGKKITFTAAEFNIIYFLARHPDKVYSAAEIYDNVWNQPNLGDAHTVQVHLAQARKKMNGLREGHNYIETIWGRGYKFNS